MITVTKNISILGVDLEKNIFQIFTMDDKCVSVDTPSIFFLIISRINLYCKIVTGPIVRYKFNNARQFRNGRHLSAFLGLVPRQHSSGSKQYPGKISKHGNAYLRRLLIHSARGLCTKRMLESEARCPAKLKRLLVDKKKKTNVESVAWRTTTPASSGRYWLDRKNITRITFHGGLPKLNKPPRC